MPKITITIQAELDDLEAKCFNNNMTDEDLDGQADTIKDILRSWNFASVNWEIEKPFVIPSNIRRMIIGR